MITTPTTLITKIRLNYFRSSHLGKWKSSVLWIQMYSFFFLLLVVAVDFFKLNLITDLIKKIKLLYILL
jgi:hypothetical protein